MGPPNQPLHPDALPFGRLWYAGPDAVSNVMDYAKFRCRSHDALIHEMIPLPNCRMIRHNSR